MKTKRKSRRTLGNTHAGTALMSQKDVGEKLGISFGCVQQGEYRALRKIKEYIETEARREGVSIRDWLFGD